MESLFGSFMKPSTTNKLYVVRVPVSCGALVSNEDARCFRISTKTFYKTVAKVHKLCYYHLATDLIISRRHCFCLPSALAWELS